MMRSECTGVLRGSRGQGPGVKKSKPAMEKRRRARINASLAELRSLIPESVKRCNRRYSKMEKADILEMAVQYLRVLQNANNDKNQVSTISYGLGFSECTQEVSEFLRAASPTTSRFKDSLLEHLHCNAPNNTPDSPSSSPKKTARISTSSIFKSSSIIARCLLSSTRIITPEKRTSRSGRNSSTPAAVSSTSEDSNSEGLSSIEQGISEDNIDDNTDTSSRDLNELSQVQRSEVLKVKKDLTSSFNQESQTRGPRHFCANNNTANICNSSTSSSNIGASSSSSGICSGSGSVAYYASTIQENINETFRQQTQTDIDKLEPSLINISNTGQSNVAAVGKASNNVMAILQNTSPLLVVESLNHNEEPATKQTYHTEVTPLSAESLDHTCENTLPMTNSESLYNPCDCSSSNTSGVNSGILDSQQVSVAKENDINMSFVRQIYSDKVNENSLWSPTSKTSTRTDNNNSKSIKTYQSSAAHPNTSPKSSETILLNKKQPIQNAQDVIFQNTSMQEEQCQYHSVSTQSSCGDVNKLNIVEDITNTGNSNASSLIPVYIPTSLDGDISSMQRTFIIKSPNKLTKSNTIVPVKYTTLKATTQNVKDEVLSDFHLLTANDQDDQEITDQLVSKTMPSDVVPRSGSSFLQLQTGSENSLALPCINNSGTRAQINVENLRKDLTANTEKGLQIETGLPKTKQLYQKQPNQVVEESANESCNILTKNSETTNVSFSSVPVIKATSTYLNLTQRKRPLSSIGNLSETKTEQPNTIQIEIVSDLVKKQRRNETDLARPTFYQISLPNTRSSTLNQYSSTMFRPIAPKVGITISRSDIHPEVKPNQSYPLQTVSSMKNNLTTRTFLETLQCPNDSLQADYGSSSIPSRVTSSGTQHQTSLHTGRDRLSNELSINRIIKEDDILTTVLKSSVPLDKLMFESKRMNMSTEAQTVTFTKSETSKNYKCENQNILRHTATDDPSLYQSFINEKQIMHGNLDRDQVLNSEKISVDNLLHYNQENDNALSAIANKNATEEINSSTRFQDHHHNCKGATIMPVTNIYSSSDVTASVHHNNCSLTPPSDTPLENYTFNIASSADCSDWMVTPLSDTLSKNYISNIASSAHRSNYSVRSETPPPDTPSENYTCTRLNTTFLQTSPANTMADTLKRHYLKYDLEEKEEKELTYFMKSSEKREEETYSQKDALGKDWSSCSTTKQGNIKNDRNFDSIKANNTQHLSRLFDSISPQPLNLSLRYSSEHKKRLNVQDTHAITKENLIGLDLSTPKLTSKQSPPTAFHPIHKDVKFRTIESCFKPTFLLDTKSNKTINTDSKNDSIFFDIPQSTTVKDIHQDTSLINIETDKTCFPNSKNITTSTELGETISVQNSFLINSMNFVPKSGENTNNTVIIASPTWVPSSSPLHVSNQTSDQELLQSKSKMIPKLSSLFLKASNESGQIDIPDDDVWRPW